jgi:hypothetical protein
MIVKTPDGKVIGNLEGVVFTKMVKGNTQKLLSPPAWAIDSYVFDHVLKGRCNVIIVVDRDDHERKYTALFKTFDEHKQETSRHYGKQYYLTMDWWR